MYKNSWHSTSPRKEIQLAARGFHLIETSIISSFVSAAVEHLVMLQESLLLRTNEHEGKVR